MPRPYRLPRRPHLFPWLHPRLSPYLSAGSSIALCIGGRWASRRPGIGAGVRRTQLGDRAEVWLANPTREKEKLKPSEFLRGCQWDHNPGIERYSLGKGKRSLLG